MTSIETELAAITAEYGSASSGAVVNWARAHPGSELHRSIEWDDAKAAEYYRLFQVRCLVALVMPHRFT